MAEDIVITEALEAARIAADLIPQYHLHLIDARIMYLLTTQKRKKCDRVRLASAKKFSALERYLSSVHFHGTPEASADYGADFLILIDREEWKELSDRQRKALVDHELCFPAGTTVSAGPVEATSTRWYTGELVEVRTTRGYYLAGTPNHPILTDHGWVELGHLHEGDYVVSSLDPERISSTMNPDKYQVPAPIEEVVHATNMVTGVVPQTPEDFDTNVVNGQINVVSPNSCLLLGNKSFRSQHLHQIKFSGGDSISQMILPRQGEFFHGDISMFLASPSVMSLLEGDSSLGVFIRSGHPSKLPFTSVPKMNTSGFQDTHDRPTVETQFLREAIDGYSRNIQFDQLCMVRRRIFRGHVYNLQTKGHWYSANHIITHNCHCARFEKITDTGVEGHWGLKSHDIEEFTGVVARHGLWRQEAQDMAKVMQQLSLDLEAPHASDETQLTLHVPGYAPVTASVEDFKRATDAITRG